MTIYIDSNFICHTAQETGGALRPFDVPALDGRCRTYLEGMRYVPAGETWTSSDGTVFAGEMLAPCKNFDILEAAQSAYEDAVAQIAPKQEAQDAQIAYIGMMAGVI
ncbi:MAG: hypothetical protein RSC36_04260 [Ruthenibacterium sp.]